MRKRRRMLGFTASAVVEARRRGKPTRPPNGEGRGGVVGLAHADPANLGRRGIGPGWQSAAKAGGGVGAHGLTNVCARPRDSAGADSEVASSTDARCSDAGYFSMLAVAQMIERAAAANAE